MSEKTYYQRNRDVVLNRAKDYYENDKKTLREQAYLKKKKKKKREYGKNRYHDMPEEKKQKLKDSWQLISVFCFVLLRIIY